uniref:Dynein axonemal heavy chain 1 n=1 Tax=Ornithorhynchus anatinus TaxID=9258 RepID=A0A6I8P5E1_ORNAN
MVSFSPLQYEKLTKMVKQFQNYWDLWTTTSDWLRWSDSWMNDPLSTIDAEQLEKNVNESFKTMHKCVKQFKDLPACLEVAEDIRARIEEFKPYIPLIQGLRNPGMRTRHWEALSVDIHINIKPKVNLTFSRCLDMKLQEHVEIISKVAETASKEYAIEQALDKMEKEWIPIVFNVLPYKDTGTFVLKSPEEASQLLDDHIVMIQSMSFSPYKKPFEERIRTWENKLKLTQDVLEEWLACQRSWLYLEPIFSSEDITKQLPVESKRYQTMERTWKKVMRNVNENRQEWDWMNFGQGMVLFYFLSDDELLEILSQTRDPTAVQPHLRKCFENIAQVNRAKNGFQTKKFPFGRRKRKRSRCPIDWKETPNSIWYPRTTWVLSWPGQVIIAGCQTFWTQEVSEALQAGDLAIRLYPQLGIQLNDLVALVRGKLSKIQRTVLSALIVIEVHAKDVAAKLIEENVISENDFEWISQLRYYWKDSDLYIQAVNAEFMYGYEYLGNSGRLVITPLTDRCYLTLTGALHLKFGGAPAGPAGTGKTETTKDLGKAMAVQTVVFNCSDQLDYMAMGKFFKGLASSGAWACFDEFNRIDIEVLSVVAQQIATIQKAQQQRVDHFVFEGVEIPLVSSCAVFITMNPGYAGRTELPDNLKALFRPVAMMVPDYTMIAEISLYSFGFGEAKVLARKITTTFKLSSEQLSSQDHYDFGMRAVKTVISAAGNLKRENPTMNEELICLRAIRDVNVPKFLMEDLKLFSGIVSDLFPKIKEEEVDYGILETAIRKNTCSCLSLGFLTKCIQLYETTVVRHGLMLVGPAGSGKSQASIGGDLYEAVQYYILNPKSITMGQLYGEFDLLTHEWTDGIFSTLIRAGALSRDCDKKWYMFDGPVDAIWIENMNTVLDDNKKLCLSSGEIIKLTEAMTLMFEVQDLAVASPATVSRCGMVYLEPSLLGLSPFTECWLEQMPEAMKPFREELHNLFDRFLEVSAGAMGGFWAVITQLLFCNNTGYPSSTFTIQLDANFADIIIPTMDTIQMSHLLGMLLTNRKPVLCIGPTGTGKSLTISDKLLKNLPLEYISHFLTFSARTSANQTQDFIDSKLDKRRKGVYGPPLGRSYIFFIDDLNLPALETFGAQPPIELLRQWMDHKGWYDRKLIGSFRQLVDINFVCAMGPPGGGRNAITPRLTRHFNYLSFTELDDNSKKTIFSTILGCWIAPTVEHFTEDLVRATINVYSIITSQLLPTPNKSHYTFNLRDLSKVFQGMLMAEPTKIQVSSFAVGSHLLRKVQNPTQLHSVMESWGVTFDDVIPFHPMLYGDFMTLGTDTKIYELISDIEKLMRVLDDYMEDYNEVHTTKLKLVLFIDAMSHICRISRILRQSLGNALLLGVGGSGRSSLTRLASHIAEYECFQIELSKNYGMAEWRENIKQILLKAGVNNLSITFLFSDTQIKNESFLEDINSVLNSGDIPNLYSLDEQDQILTSMRPIIQERGLQPSKANLMAAYTGRVRNNIHTVLCMSPIGEIFRARLRQFPSLVNCCTIDWFNEWPAEALESVAFSFLSELPDLETNLEVIDALVGYNCSGPLILSSDYLAELARYNYVTPKSYLELLNIFSVLIGKKKQELIMEKDRMKGGLNKVAALTVCLPPPPTQMDTAVAEDTRSDVQAEEKKANEKAQRAQAIADDAQKDLDEALPALSAALASLRNLNKNDVTEVRAMQRPPPGVKLVIETVCIMKGVKPKKLPGEKPGTKIEDYWEPGRILLQDPGRFLDSLFKYDKDNIPDTVIRAIQPYIDNDEFQPAAIAKVSKACTSICQWVRAMHKYHFVAKGVAPKRVSVCVCVGGWGVLGHLEQALREAQEDLAVTQKDLDIANQRLRDVEDVITIFHVVLVPQLINGLSDEKLRWEQTVEDLDDTINNIYGDVMVSAGFVAYLGPFTVKSRKESLLQTESSFLTEPTLIGTLGNAVQIRSWQIAGLPKDTLSVENGVIAQYSQRWTHFIDPQGQANKWIKNMEKENGLDVIKLNDLDFLRSLENAIRFGKPCLLENVGEELDPVLDTVLLKQTFKQQGNLVLKLGDAIIPYHEDFKMYITTKLPNPHYIPEISTKVTLINFTLSPSGLEDQLLGQVVAQERPDLEEAKNQLIITNARMRQELKDIEDQILFRLSSSEGNLVDDVELIRVLEASKLKAADIQAKVKITESTEKDIDLTRMEYVPVATRTKILFFCMSDLSNVDPMYQYSLEWFLKIFLSSITNSEKTDSVKRRIENINKYLTYSLYSNVCRSLFEKHKLMFAFLLCVRIMMNDGKIKMAEWRYLLSGGSVKKFRENPAVDWLSERAWRDIMALTNLETFTYFANDFVRYLQEFRDIFDSPEPHRKPLPGRWNNRLDQFQKLLVLRCLRGDKVTNAMQDFIANNLEPRFIEPHTADLMTVFKESSTTTPLIFVLSPGTDPAADLYKFADEMKFSKKFTAISLGQGQGPLAEAMMENSIERGKWVFFQNCHLAPSWMPSLERLIEAISTDKVHRDFRLWLTSLPSNKFPVTILQNGSKMTIEPPKGFKANLLKSYGNLSDHFLNSCGKGPEFKALLLSLCLFHGNVLERRKFGPLGFNIPYEFTDGDLRICISQLKMFLNEYSVIPFKVLKYTAGEINYGGRVTDDWDRRCIMTILEDFYNPEALIKGGTYPVKFNRALILLPIPQGYIQYIKSLPLNDMPEIFGLHDNANITFAQNETFALLNSIIQLQQIVRSSIHLTCSGILQKIPPPINLRMVMKRYPVLYEESMNTVLVQEVIRFNRLLEVMMQTLKDLLKALKGLVVMSLQLELMATSLYNNTVPELWNSKAYPSLKPLSSWVIDLLQRIHFLETWIMDGIPSVFWISGFFFPQAFLTGTLQNFARKFLISIDTISFSFQVMRETASELKVRPNEGCYICGLFLEGARWDSQALELAESRPKELYTEMAVIWLLPMSNRKSPTHGFYLCPIYKTLTRAGTLSTTGHSTNYVIAIEIPTSKSEGHWIKRGVALICALDY